MGREYKLRARLLFTLLPAVLLILVIGSFLIYSFYDRFGVQRVVQKQFSKNKDEKIRFLVFGDSGSGNKEQRALADLMEKENPYLILHTGDLAYERGTAKEINDKVITVYQNLFAKAAFYPTLGNHDYLTANAQPYLDTFDLPGNERYYSVSVGNILFVALDSNSPLDSIPNQMLPWLENTLSTKSQANDWVVAYFHHPAYSSGSHGSEKRIQDKVVPILEKYKVDIVFSGHDHNYQRTCEIMQNQCTKNGVTYIVTGGGGRDLYPVGEAQWFTQFQKSTYHFLEVETNGCKLSLKAIDLSGDIFDSFEKSKCQ